MDFVLTNPVGATRPYSTFTSVLTDTIDARAFLGIHFRNPDVRGARRQERSRRRHGAVTAVVGPSHLSRADPCDGATAPSGS